MKKPHKHAELIKAWADGAEIEWKYYDKAEWVLCKKPVWREQVEYRIKPEPKPDVVRYVTYEWNPRDKQTYGGIPNQKQSLHANLKLTFDGETGKLKSAEEV